MPDRSGIPKRPRDLNKLAASIVRAATEGEPDSGKDPAAVALGRKGGLKGGPARASKLSKKRRSEIAKKAAKARWAQESDQGAHQPPIIRVDKVCAECLIAAMSTLEETLQKAVAERDRLNVVIGYLSEALGLPVPPSGDGSAPPPGGPISPGLKVDPNTGEGRPCVSR